MKYGRNYLSGRDAAASLAGKQLLQLRRIGFDMGSRRRRGDVRRATGRAFRNTRRLRRWTAISGGGVLDARLRRTSGVFSGRRSAVPCAAGRRCSSRSRCRTRSDITTTTATRRSTTTRGRVMVFRVASKRSGVAIGFATALSFTFIWFLISVGKHMAVSRKNTKT